MQQLIDLLSELSLSARQDNELDAHELEFVGQLRELEHEHSLCVRGLSEDEYALESLKRGRDVTHDGYAIYSSLQQTLSSFIVNPALRVRRSPMQIEFHNKALNALFFHIYNQDWLTNEQAILEKHNLVGKKVKRHLLLSCPRRFGKTTAVAFLIAAILYCIPKQITVVACSQISSTSKILIRMVRSLLTQLPGTADKVFFHNNGNRPTIEYSRKGERNDPLASVVVGLPAGTDNNRGRDADIVIFDEMGFMKASAIGVIGALLRKTGSVLIGLSSLQRNEASFFNQLLEEKGSDGELLFEVSRTELMCHDCRQNKEAMSCPHMRDDLPAFLTNDSDEIIAALMKSEPALYQSEILGISHSLAAKAINGQLLQKVYMEPPIYVREDVPLVHVFVDPSGGGGSKSAAVSLVVLSDFTIGVCFFIFLSRV